MVDRNGLQISGPTEKVMAHENLHDRWAAFGWSVLECNGNDIIELDKAFTEAKNCTGVPTVIIAKTIKGYGYSGAENQTGWHHKVPTQEQMTAILKELDERGAAV